MSRTQISPTCRGLIASATKCSSRWSKSKLLPNFSVLNNPCFKRQTVSVFDLNSLFTPIVIFSGIYCNLLNLNLTGSQCNKAIVSPQSSPNPNSSHEKMWPRTCQIISLQPSKISSHRRKRWSRTFLSFRKIWLSLALILRWPRSNAVSFKRSTKRLLAEILWEMKKGTTSCQLNSILGPAQKTQNVTLRQWERPMCKTVRSWWSRY